MMARSVTCRLQSANQAYMPGIAASTRSRKRCTACAHQTQMTLPRLDQANMPGITPSHALPEALHRLQAPMC